MNLTGDFLISIPSANVGTFNRSVVLMSEHTGNGAQGWIVNKQLDDKVSQRLRKGMSLTRDIPLYFGGPVDVNNAVVDPNNGISYNFQSGSFLPDPSTATLDDLQLSSIALLSILARRSSYVGSLDFDLPSLILLCC